LVSTGKNHPYSTIRVLRESRRKLDTCIKKSTERTKEICRREYIYKEEFIFSIGISKDHKKRKS
jgi:hypothetical protein